MHTFQQQDVVIRVGLHRTDVDVVVAKRRLSIAHDVPFFLACASIGVCGRCLPVPPPVEG